MAQAWRPGATSGASECHVSTADLTRDQIDFMADTLREAIVETQENMKKDV